MDVVDAWAMGRPNQPVVGESYYEDALRRVVTRAAGGSAGEMMVRAVLLPEPDNRYDRNAVAVTIDGEKVGHLPREDAVRYSAELAHLAAAGHHVAVPASVWWVDHGEGDWASSVNLTLAEPGLLLPVNAPPVGVAQELPIGAAIQISGEEMHLDVLVPVLGRAGQVAIYASLHELAEQRSRSVKAVVEVRLDGARVGQLTPTMSDHLLPCVRHGTSLGATVYCRAQAKGNALKVDVTLFAARSVDVPQSWISELERKAGVATSPVRPAVARSQVPPIASTPPLPPAGWYTNPAGRGLRWWDGAIWTEHTHDA